MPNIFKITESDLLRYDLDPEDLGTWCWDMNGKIQGFANSYNDAVDMITHHCPPAVIYIKN